MTCAPIIGRELRAEAREAFAYWLRVLGALAVLVVFLVLVLHAGGDPVPAWGRKLARQHFLGAWLATVVAGLLLPWVGGGLLLGLVLATAVLSALPVNTHVYFAGAWWWGVVLQAVGAALALVWLRRDLARRRFVLS